MDSTSYRVYTPATGTVRESRNVIFIETPSAIPEPDLANGLEEREFTYDDVDDVERDIRNYSSNIDLSSSPAAGQEVRNPSVPTTHRVIRLGETTLEETALVLRLWETAPLHLREGALQVQVVVLSRVVAPVIRGCLLYTSPSPRD